MIDGILNFQITYDELIVSIGSIFQGIRKHTLEE